MKEKLGKLGKRLFRVLSIFGRCILTATAVVGGISFVAGAVLFAIVVACLPYLIIAATIMWCVYYIFG